MTRLKCLKCGDIIEGDKKGTYITCGCKAIAIDETEYYVRVIGDKSNFEEIIDPANYTTTPSYGFMELEEAKKKALENKITKDKAELICYSTDSFMLKVTEQGLAINKSINFMPYNVIINGDEAYHLANLLGLDERKIKITIEKVDE